MAADTAGTRDGAGRGTAGARVPRIARSPLVWWRRQSLRFRLTATASAALAVALAVAAYLLVGVLGRALMASTESIAYQRAREVVALADDERLPDPIAVTDGTIVQVVDARGRITHVTAGADRLVPLADPRAPSGDRGRMVDGGPFGIPGPLLVVVLRADEGRTVITARPFKDVADSLTTTVHMLALATPVLLVLLGAATWLIVGRTLRPIAALRRGAAEISGTARARRLPVPEARDEVHELATTLNDMLARLEAAEASQRALVSDAAHELRSPLASIRLQLEVALGHPDGQDWPETAEGVLEDTLRLSRLAEGLLTLARLDERRRPARWEPVELADLVRAMAARYDDAVVTVGRAEQAVVRGDALDLGRVLVNLLDNAVRHAGARVRLDLRASREHAVITVTDDGPGIPEQDRERVFHRFTRLDGARSRDDGGAGLGLAIVRETVRAHGGAVHLEDASPGLRAVVRLPLSPSPE
ncbi:two-component sensor histidine kinase [Sphaerisporangium krabiense]|uniref:histidine kinase n=1 Tax=Sphaerisporangium krabiense TaxID=763782 RepID=A0A7W8Z9B5_9ACTN|nr:ATP-binding protein [Sphaerisporangium krabiense]MBB5629809.1 signal transduction histidine kinase [Sphaerisporangium krabiense]GII63908.1 two-component sensor histidine kinase [Sphaerisporangium krabiense]